MIVRLRGEMAGLLLVALGGCATNSAKTDSSAAARKETTAAMNPLLAPWQGPWGGVPPFGKFKVSDLKPALEAAMAENLAEVDRIAADPAAPSFDNTIVAMERTGKALDRAGAIYGIYTSTMSDAEVQAIETEMSPKLAEFNDKIVQNSRLFARIAAVYEARARLGLNAEQQRLLWLDYTNFVRAGAKLDDAKKKRLGELNQQLAALYTRFS